MSTCVYCRESILFGTACASCAEHYKIAAYPGEHLEQVLRHNQPQRDLYDQQVLQGVLLCDLEERVKRLEDGR